MRLVNGVSAASLDAPRAVNDSQRRPGTIVEAPARGTSHHQASVTHAVAVPIALELDRAVGHHGSDLGLWQRPEPCAARLGIDDHRICGDPVRAEYEPALITIVAETPRDKAGIVATAEPASQAVRASGTGIATTGADQVATGTDHGARPVHGRSRGWRCPYLHAHKTTLDREPNTVMRYSRGMTRSAIEREGPAIQEGGTGISGQEQAGLLTRWHGRPDLGDQLEIRSLVTSAAPDPE